MITNILFYIAIGYAILLTFLGVLLIAIRQQLGNDDIQRFRIAYKDKSHYLHRLSRRFLISGFLIILLTLIHYAKLLSIQTDSAAYEQAMRQPQRTSATVIAITHPWYTCVGKPSICTQKITAKSRSGNTLLMAYYLQYGDSLFTGQQIELVIWDNTYFIADHPPFQLHEKITLNSLIIGLLGFLFFSIGFLLRAGFYLLTH